MIAALIVAAQLHVATPVRATRVIRHDERPPLLLVSVGVTALATGAVLGVFGVVPSSVELDARCPDRRCADRDINRVTFDRVQSFSWGADLAFGIGAFYVAAGAAWWLVAHFDRPVVQIAPAVGTDGAGLIATGRF